jgi:hypothetical protein
MFARFAYVEDRPDDDAAGDASAASEEPEVARDDEIIIQESSPDNAAPSAATSSFFSSAPASPPHDAPAVPADAAAPAETPADTPADDAPAADTLAADTPADDAPAADTPAADKPTDTPAAAPPAKRHKPLPLMGAGERHGPGTIGHETRPEVLINTWQGMAAGATSPANRRFIIVCGVILSSQTLTGTACKAIKALRDAARADGADDLDPAWLAAKEGVADVISMVNFRNNKAKFLVALATNVKRCRGRVAESTEGYLGYKGVGKELAGLLRLVNTAPLAEEWCLKEQH